MGAGAQIFQGPGIRVKDKDLRGVRVCSLRVLEFRAWAFRVFGLRAEGFMVVS